MLSPLVQMAADLSPLQAATRLGTAALLGLAVGAEREWSGHATGPNARFAGLRTFLLFGILGGAAGLLHAWGYALAAAPLILAGALFVVASYVMAARRPGADLDGTTEAAALVVIALGALAGVGEIGLASGAAAVVVFALGEKARLHWLVQQIGEREMRAALQFAVLALVILPILPEGPFLPVVEIRPRMLWGIVVLLSGINFAGYLARRAVGASRGYGVAGMIGGVVSSTAVTLQFSRLSRDSGEPDGALALGVIGACSVLPVRVALIAMALESEVGNRLLVLLLPSALVGFAIVALALRRQAQAATPQNLDDGNPLKLRSAIQMALLFQAAMTVLSVTGTYWGTKGLTASAVLLGLTDVDALTVSMTQAARGGILTTLAAQSIAVGILSNTVFKLLVSLVVGRGRFRPLAAAGLVAIGAAILVTMLLLAS
ncbi:MAG: DUF4010 domain-containing protein [Gemmatimonadaceae bacterium]